MGDSQMDSQTCPPFTDVAPASQAESSVPLMSDIPLNNIKSTTTNDSHAVKAKKAPKVVNITIPPVGGDDDVFKTDADREYSEGSDEADGAGNGRGNWGGQLEFIFTCIGYAVGLGNVWRFPYLCYKNGGGAFLLPYIIMLAFVGLPLFFLELAFGQFASLGPITVWKLNPLFKGLGYAMVSVSWLIAVYYNVIISHVLLYLFASFASITTYLPWTSCNNAWNTELCLEETYPSDNATSSNVTALEGDVIPNNGTEIIKNGTGLLGNLSRNTPTEEYYKFFVLDQSTGIDEFGAINWKLALCLLLAWGIVLVCLIRGIQSLGKVVYFTAIFPYIMLTILLIRGLTLPGALQGIIYYLKPDISRLADARVWSDAATQIFYSLSACSGGLIAMASYNKFDNNCLRDSLIVSLINCATSIYAGFVIFAILGFMAYEKGVEVADVADDGPGLVFVVYPEALSRMPCPQLWAICFFFMMATLGFGSQFSIVECVLSALTDEFAQYLRGKWQSVIFRTAVILLTFLLGLPMVAQGGIYLLNLVDYSVSGFPLLFVGLLELIAVHWIYGFNNFSADIFEMLKKLPNIYWKATWMIIAPLIILVTIIFNCVFYKEPMLDDYSYPDWAQSLGWCIALFPILLIPGYAIYLHCRKGGLKLMWDLMQPVDWRPTELKDENRYDRDVPLTPSRLNAAENRFNFDNMTISIPVRVTDTSGETSRAPIYTGAKPKRLLDLRGDQERKTCSTSDLHMISSKDSGFQSQTDLSQTEPTVENKSRSWLSIPRGSFRNIFKKEREAKV